MVIEYEILKESKIFRLLDIYTETLIRARSWLLIYDMIATNKEKIDNTGHVIACELIQVAAFNTLAVEMFNIFDKKHTENGLTVLGILHEIKNSEHQFDCSNKVFQKYVDLCALKKEDCSNLLGLTKEIKKEIEAIHKEKDFKKIVKVRHNFVSHRNREQSLKNPKKELPSVRYFENLLKWSNDFRKLCYFGYLTNFIPVDIYTESEKRRGSFFNILKSAIPNVQKNPP